RLLTEPIPGQEEGLRLLVPHREGEHSSELLDTLFAHLFVEVHDHFRVGGSLEPMPAGHELIPQLEIVVDLPVEGDPYRSILAAYRLMARVEIDDGQAPHRHPEGSGAADVHSFVIRTPVLHDSRHPR